MQLCGFLTHVSLWDFDLLLSLQSRLLSANFEMLDAKIASALNKIIQNSNFKKKVSLEEHKAQKARTELHTRKTDRLHDPRLFSSDWRS